MCPRQRLPKASRGRQAHRVAVLVAALLVGAQVLGGCALNGDFDRVRPSLVTDDMHAWVGRDAVASIGLPPSDFKRMTDDERQLRDLAYAMIAPPYERARWDSVFLEYGLGRPAPREPVRLDRGAYWRRLNDEWRRSETSGYAQLMTDSRNDVIRIEPFFAIAIRVADMDRKRAKVAAVAAKSPAEYDNALFRNNENTAIVAWVCRSLRERTSSYGYALERMVIRTPSPMAADAERELSMLGARIAQYCQPGVGAVLIAKD
jgi:hypothetical protein